VLAYPPPDGGGYAGARVNPVAAEVSRLTSSGLKPFLC